MPGGEVYAPTNPPPRSRLSPDRRQSSGVLRVVVLPVFGRFELEGRMLDVEVLGQARLQAREDVVRPARPSPRPTR